MDTKPLSPLQETGLACCHIGKLTGMLGPALENSALISGVPTAELEQFIKSGGAGLQAAWTEIFELRLQVFRGRVMVDLNYDEPHAIATALEENNFGYIYLCIKASEIPLVGQGQVIREVHEVHFGRVMYNRDLLQALKERGVESGFPTGFKFADPLTALRYTLKVPDQQCKYRLGILFMVKNQLYSLILDKEDRRRRACVYWSHPGAYWSASDRLLAAACE